MAWSGYTNFRLVVLKNGVEVERGEYSGFLVTTKVLNRYNNSYNSTSSSAGIPRLSSAYATNASATSSSDYWENYVGAAARTSSILKSEGIESLLTAIGDRLTYYNPDVGSRYAMVLERVSDSSGIKRAKIYWIAAGTTYDYNVILSYGGRDGYNRERSICLGVLRDGYGAIPFYMHTVSQPISEGSSSSDLSPIAVLEKSRVETTEKYNWFFIFSSEWQPPEPPPPPAPDEPYGDDTYTVSTGGDGDHDDSSDTISQDAIPIAAATRSGMCTAWVPNWGEIQDVADALLDPNIFQILGSNVVKFSDVIIGLSIFPCTVPATDTDTVKANVLGIEIGTGVQAHIADDQFVSIDCGTLDITEYWGNCLDYNPYTRISIFLPFCGMYELDVDEVMGKTIGVSYRIDIMSGACLATIKINGSVFYQYSGQCSAQVPLSSVSFDQFLSSMIELGVATATGVGAVGAAGGAATAARDQMFVPQSRADLRSHTEEIASAEQNYSKVKEQSANSIADAAVGAVMGAKGFYQHAGAMSGSPGFLGVRTPYLIIKRPEQLIPGMYGKFHGFPCNTTAVLGDLVGYTEIGDIRLNIPEATVDEIIECEQLLKGGVVI